ncbi:MAG: septum formation inhibitor-activating ATPase [Afipia sp.]|nr:septum formation inhibitor-activating ATPase [Afipia sp.]
MTARILDELKQQAARATGPGIAPMPTIILGGVDPLGLRQINFDLMDEVLPGLNNVARHIRPFVVVAWAWRRATQIAQQSGKKRIEVDLLRDFVDRIEVIYGWSQFLKNPAADLPGRDVLRPLLKVDLYTFAGEAWKKRREAREDSTAFLAAINYGPALKSMGWLHSHPEDSKLMIADEYIQPALSAFEKTIAADLDHPAFSKLGKVTVTKAEATKWGKAWAIEKYSKAEQKAFEEALLGARSPKARQLGMKLVIAASKSSHGADVGQVRRRMSGGPPRLKNSTEHQITIMNWRRVQVRQLFRFCLESMLFWAIAQLQDSAAPTSKLVSKFLKHTKISPSVRTTAKWLQKHYDPSTGPVELIEQLESAHQEERWEPLAVAITQALAFCMLTELEQGQVVERPDRLPISRARTECAQRFYMKPAEFMKHIFESWILAQHVYWSVGRGLADARARGKSILRLKVVLEDGGWALAPGVTYGSLPVPTADRLQTALSLAYECGLIDEAPKI